MALLGTPNRSAAQALFPWQFHQAYTQIRLNFSSRSESGLKALISEKAVHLSIFFSYFQFTISITKWHNLAAAVTAIGARWPSFYRAKSSFLRKALKQSPKTMKKVGHHRANKKGQVQRDLGQCDPGQT